MDRKIRILVWSDLIAATGFSRVSHSIFKFLEDKMDVVGLGINYRGDPHNYTLKVFPAGINGDVYGNSRLPEFVNFDPDIIFMVNDAWVLDPMLKRIKEVFNKRLPKIVCYIPVDAEDHISGWYRNFDIVTVPVAYTEWGKSVILKAAPELEDRIKVIPHGVDLSVFNKLDKLDTRKQLFGTSFANTEPFIFLSAVRNQPRKRLDVTMRAFKMFSENKPDNVKLYMHCGVVDSSINVSELARRFDIENRLIITSLQNGIQQVPTEFLNKIYNACDVGLNTSLGEGWSLCNIEHAVTGAPQIVPNHSALSELYRECGALVPATIPWVMDSINTTGKLVLAEDVAKAMEDLYSNKTYYSLKADIGIKKFTSDEYQWKTIANSWYSVFESLME